MLDVSTYREESKQLIYRNKLVRLVMRGCRLPLRENKSVLYMCNGRALDTYCIMSVTILRREKNNNSECIFIFLLHIACVFMFVLYSLLVICIKCGKETCNTYMCYRIYNK